MNEPAQKHSRLFRHLVAIAVLAGLTLALFADVLFCSSQTVLSKPGCDLANLFIPLRGFAIKEVLSGNLPLWNPFLQAGTPFFGQFETALFYPLSFIYLILPLAKAINTSIALHTFLSGLFMYLWATHRKLHPMAALLTGVILMFCGARYAHISAGHLSNLATMTWAPLLFLAIDGLFERPRVGWILLGTTATSLMVYAGHPQYVYFTAIAAAIYCILCLVHSPHRKPVLIGLVGMCLFALGLVSVKLLTGMAVAGESVRSGGLDPYQAHVCSFPPENFLTLLCPYFFGNPSSGAVDYWGRWFWWEMCLFISTSALFMAFYGARYGHKTTRRFSITMTLIMLVFSMGGYLPVFSLTCNLIPGFDMFRGHGKFIFHASLFLIMLVGIGFDHLIRCGAPKWSGIATTLAVPCLLVVASIFLGIPAAHFQEHGLWSEILLKVKATAEASQYFSHDKVESQRGAGILATWSLVVAAGTGFAFVGLLIASRRWPRVVYGTALLATLELLAFARLARPTFNSENPLTPELSSMSATIPRDQRVLFCGDGLKQMAMNVHGIWGAEVVPMKRYAEFMAFTQGMDPDRAHETMSLTKPHPFWSMLRCKYVIVPEDGKYNLHVFQEPTLPRLLLVNRCRIMNNRDQIFAAMSAPEFDPYKEVILEREPMPAPKASSTSSGEARVIESSTDYVIIEADLPEPAILINTSAYSKGWRALSLAGSVQKKYKVMPANYVLRGIPLAAGHHRIGLEYAPLPYRVGRWISLIAFIAYLLALGWWIRHHGKGKGVMVAETTPKPSRHRGKAPQGVSSGWAGLVH